MQVFFYDTLTKLPLGNATQVASLTELLGMSDIVTLHVPETAETQWMIGEKEIRAIKKGGILINAARGTVVELDALADAIKDKHLIGAAIDVFPVEPRSNDDIFESPLRGLDNVILTPHIGGSTAEAQSNIGLEVSEKLVKYSDNGTSVSSVNFPEVALPGSPWQAPSAAHPPEHPWRDDGDQQGLRRKRHQHLRSVPADQQEGRLRGHRRRRRVLRPGAREAAAHQRHYP